MVSPPTISGLQLGWQLTSGESLQPSLMGTYIEGCLREFDTNPYCRSFLSRLADDWPQPFCLSALSHVELDPDSGAIRMLAAILQGQPLICDLIANPARPRLRAANALRRLLICDPMFDLRLARRLPDATGSNHGEAFDSRRSVRALEILDDTSPGRRLIPILGHLANSSDRSVAAKATLFVGKRVKSPAWVERQLHCDDSRTRANAIESLWGVQTDEARKLLESCVNDVDNRVAGNALVGLHILGGAKIEDTLRSMATMPVTAFRATAAWAIGQLADPAFLPELRALLDDPVERVRIAAEVALKKVPEPGVPCAGVPEELQPERAASPAVIPDPEPELVPPVDPETTVQPAQVVYIPELKLDGSSFSSKIKKLWR